MRIKAGTIGVDLTADGKDFETTLKRADNLTEAFEANVDRRMKRAGNSLKGLGQAAGLTDKELSSLEKRMREGLAADSASRALEQLRRYAGLSASEYRNLATQMGVTTRASEKAGTSLGTLAKQAAVATAAYLSLRTAASLVSQTFADFRDYQSALVDMPKVTDQDLGKIDAAIKAMPRELGDPTSLLKGYYQTISAGVTDSTAAMDLLTTASKAAKAAHVSQEETIKGLTKTLAGFDGEIRNASEASDLLFKIEKLGQTSFAELVPVVGDIAAATHLVGVKSQEMAAGLSLITQTAGSTAEAATKWRGIMIGLYKPTENLQKVLTALGYQSGQAMIQHLGLADTLRTLQAVAEKSGFSLGKLFEDSEALTGIAALSAQQWGRYATILDDVRTGTDLTNQAFDRWKVSAQGVKDTYDATLKQVAIEFGSNFAPMMTRAMKDFQAELARPEGKAALESLALGVATLGENLLQSAVPGLTATVNALNDIIAAWNKIPAPLQGVLVGGGVGALLSKGNPWVTGVAALGGMAVFGDAANDRSVAEGMARGRKESQTQAILHGDTDGTIPELQTMFPDLASQVQNAKKQIDAIKVSLKDGLGSAAAEKTINDSLLAYAQQALSAGVKYELGAKSLSSGRIDCSGFVEGANETLFKSIGDQLSTAGIDPGMARAFADSSEGIITRVHKLTGQWWTGVTSGIEKSMLRPGMLIGFDTGPTKFDAGRALGIDHIVQVVQDITGALQVIQSSSSGGGVNIKSLESYLAAMKNAKAFVVDPYTSVRDKSLDSLSDYQKYSDGVRSIQKDLTRDIMASTLKEHQYKRWAIDQEIADIRNSEGYLFADIEQRKAIEDQLAQYRVQKLREVSEEEVRFRADSLRDFAQMSSQIGELSGNMELLRSSKMQEVQAWADELIAKAKKLFQGEELDRFASSVKQLQGLKGYSAVMDTATSYPEYAGAYNKINSEEKKAHEVRLEIYEQDLQGFSEISSKMVLVRMAAYDEIIAAAQKAGDKEREAFSKVNKEDAMEKTLKDIQKYGNATDAFYATLSLKFGTYKDDMSRMRDNAKMLGESLFDLSRDISSAIGDTFGDLVKGVAKGSLDIEDIGSSLLENLGDAFGNFAQKILEQWINNIFDSIAKQFTEGFLTKTFGATANSSWSLLSLFGFAHGGTFAGTTLPTNSILTSPTLFTTADSGFHAFASGGLGVAGEKGYEAIMPLKRMSNNDLGVKVDVGQNSQRQQETKPPVVNANTKVINVLDGAVLGDYMKSAAGEKIIVNVMRRNGVM